jgi:pimeloyl-ACP methyl ester carboxylesterase
LPRLACPTLLVAGERETAWARAATDELARLIPGAQARTSPGVGHLHPLSGAAWLAEIVGEWLTGVPRVAPGARDRDAFARPC